MRALRSVCLTFGLIAGAIAPPAALGDGVRWSVAPNFQVRLAAPPSSSSAATRRELTELRELQRRRTGALLARLGRWSSRSAIGTWTQVTLDEIRAHSSNPARAARALALVTVAMNDAIQTLRRSLAGRMRPSPCRLDARIRPLGGRCTRSVLPPDTAAAGQAAALVLAHLFADRRAQLTRMASAAASWPLWSGTGYRSDVEAGMLVGRRVAQRVIARARRDGSDSVWTGVRPSGPGLWEPTPPDFAAPLEPLAGTWRTWNLNRSAQFRPAPPPRPGSELFDAEAQEVYDVSLALTDEQRRIAHFWSDGSGTVTPPGHWTAIALRMIRSRPPGALGPARGALVLATLSTAQADAFIACWDAKYGYWSVRPVTYLQQWWYAPGWSPLLVTPPFPSYVSGHATTSAAAATVLASFFPSQRARLRRLADEAAQSRLFAGIHFASDTVAGVALGRKVAGEALRRISQSPHQRR